MMCLLDVEVYDYKRRRLSCVAMDVILHAGNELRYLSYEDGEILVPVLL